MKSATQSAAQKQPVPRVSAIIPALNEARVIAPLLEALRLLTPRPEILVVDGQSTDDTAGLARIRADAVIACEPGRGRQLNTGARRALGEILWFVHADSQLHTDSVGAILAAMDADRELAGGAFRLRFTRAGAGLRVIAGGANLRSRLLKLPWGDQGIFVRRDVYERLGGFLEWPLLEDHEFMRRLRRAGKITLLKTPIFTSPRRYLKLGLLKTVRINLQILWWFRRGLPIEEIQRRCKLLAEQGGGVA